MIEMEGFTPGEFVDERIKEEGKAYWGPLWDLT
jgi:hypothetical protein